MNPSADVVVRVFMLFKGIREDEASGWEEARCRGLIGVDWKAVVGVDEKVGKLADSSLFRVLEWGGMEVF